MGGGDSIGQVVGSDGDPAPGDLESSRAGAGRAHPGHLDGDGRSASTVFTQIEGVVVGHADDRDSMPSQQLGGARSVHEPSFAADVGAGTDRTLEVDDADRSGDRIRERGQGIAMRSAQVHVSCDP